MQSQAGPSLDSIADALQGVTPWLDPFAVSASAALEHARGRSVADALNALATTACPIRFVDPSALPAEEPYEAFIHRTGFVPTRNSAHDFFNGLMWLHYPATKRRLNVLQANEIAVRGTRGPRGALRDALTIFDENAALLAAPAPLNDALRERDWHRLFIEQRDLWKHARVVLFGHALLEKLLQPRKTITAHVWLVDDVADEAVAASLDPNRLANKDFLPLPILGIPGWWPENERAEYYEDASVFRRS